MDAGEMDGAGERIVEPQNSKTSATLATHCEDRHQAQPGILGRGIPYSVQGYPEVPFAWTSPLQNGSSA